MAKFVCSICHTFASPFFLGFFRHISKEHSFDAIAFISHVESLGVRLSTESSLRGNRHHKSYPEGIYIYNKFL